MLHQLLFGLLLGWGAAIPIGPLNLEMIRRNLQYGTPYGMALGIGACSADVTYIILLSLGALTILTHALIMQIIGVLGSLVLAWFGFSALRLRANHIASNDPNRVIKKQYSLWRHTVEGYILTLFNPFTILFWSSVSAQIALQAKTATHAMFYAGVGVLLGTFSWVCGLNICLHFTRHKLSQRMMQYLNYAGGIILLFFAAIGFWHSF